MSTLNHSTYDPAENSPRAIAIDIYSGVRDRNLNDIQTEFPESQFPADHIINRSIDDLGLDSLEINEVLVLALDSFQKRFRKTLNPDQLDNLFHDLEDPTIMNFATALFKEGTKR